MSVPLVFLDADTISATLDWAGAVAALDRSLLDGFDPTAAGERTIVDLSHGQLLLMPAETAAAVGVKIASVTPANPERGLPRIQALYLLLDRETHEPRALLDGTALTILRTPAVSGVAVKHLARPDARRLVVFGSGPQAWGHVAALRSVRPLETITIVGRDRQRAQQLVERISVDGLPAQVGDPGAVAEADIIVCATSACTPLFDGDLVQPDTCVVAIGSHEPDRREVDAQVVRRAVAGGGVVVETRAVALREAGDVVQAFAEGACTAEDLVGIADLVHRQGWTPGVTLFKSCGMGWQDLVVAESVVQRWSVEGG